MAKEIERKFLVTGDKWKQGKRSVYKQGYLNTDPERVVRVRTVDQKGYLTVKGRSHGPTRLEYEYEIPFDEASELLTTLCHQPLIEKTRYVLPVGDVTYEVDEFLGANQGLVIAEIELQSEDQPIPKPDWLGREVTDDSRYFNSNLVLHPYSTW